MKNPELDDILASFEQLARRAYALGRADALKHVVQTMQDDESSWNPRTITGPRVAAPVEAPPAAPPEPAKILNLPRRPAEVAWWQRPPRAG